MKEEIDQLRQDLNGLGGRVSTLEQNHASMHDKHYDLREDVVRLQSTIDMHYNSSKQWHESNSRLIDAFSRKLDDHTTAENEVLTQLHQDHVRMVKDSLEPVNSKVDQIHGWVIKGGATLIIGGAALTLTLIGYIWNNMVG